LCARGRERPIGDLRRLFIAVGFSQPAFRHKPIDVDETYCVWVVLRYYDDMLNKHGPLRADTLRPIMNAAKENFVLAFIQDYRDVAVRIGRVQWRLFFEAGSTDKRAPESL